VHTEAYIKQLAATCVSLRDKADGAKSELEDDTIISASSLSAALCAVLSCCYAVDSCRVPAGESARARVSGVGGGRRGGACQPRPSDRPGAPPRAIGTAEGRLLEALQHEHGSEKQPLGQPDLESRSSLFGTY
jgi:hypothetical protein